MKKRTLLVSNHGNDVCSWHFENKDNPEQRGSEIGYELTQQHETVKAPGSAQGGTSTFLGSWQPPARSMGQRGPPVPVPSCSLQLGATQTQAVPLLWPLLTQRGYGAEKGDQHCCYSTWELPKDISWRHQKAPCGEAPENSGYRSKTVFCFPSGFLWERKLMFLLGIFLSKNMKLWLCWSKLPRICPRGRKGTVPMLAFTEYMPKALWRMFQIAFPSVDLWLYVLSPVCFPLVIGAVAITQELNRGNKVSTRAARPWGLQATIIHLAELPSSVDIRLPDQ